MEINVLKEDKNSIELGIDNVTVAEVMRVYLQDHADFAAWRREHPSKPVIFKIDSDKGVSKAVSAAVSAVRKECDQLKALVNKK